MRKSLMIIGAMAIGSIAFAQREGRMKEVLSLNDAQSESIRKINQKYGDKARAIHDDSTLQGDQRKKAHQDIRKQREAELSQVLTPEQVSKWKAYQQGRADQRRSQHQRRMRHHDERMKESLGLSDDQVGKIQQARAATREQAKALKQSGAGTEEFRKLQDEHEGKIKSILSPEQFSKWKEEQSRRRERMKARSSKGPRR